MNIGHVRESAEFVREHLTSAPAMGLVLGSGLGEFADSLPHRTVIQTSDIPHYPASTVEGHKGRIVAAQLDTKSIIAFQGRIHFYESGSLNTVLYPIRVAHELGIRTLLMTNAAGGMNRSFKAGDLMIITDHINFTLTRPVSFPAWAARQPVYSAELIEKAERAAASGGIPVKKGVYVGLKGPTYETASEVEMLYRLGGDAVGMSTVFEASLASALGMEVLGISCITNLATGISPAKLDHAEVTEVGNRVKGTFAKLVTSIIGLI